MNRIKKLLSVLLCAAMLCAVLPCVSVGAATSGTCGENLTWTLDDNGVLTISGTGDMGDYSWNGLPWYSNRSSITTVVIEDGVTSIGDSAFYRCSSLTSVTIPNSVTSIGYGAFSYCSSLTSVTIGNSVTIIGGYAFYYCSSLTSVEIPDSVTSIGEYAFRNCSSLTSVEIGNGVTSIGNEAFYGCSSLTSVEIGNSVTSIGSEAFYGCSSLTSVEIGSGVTSIGEYAFAYCRRLTSVEMGSGVTSLGEYAFAYCSSLTSVEIPESVTSIGCEAFYNTAYYNDETNWENGVLYIGNHLIKADSGVVAGDYEIKEGTICIAEDAFYYCTGLTSVTIPDSVTSIGDLAFAWCSSLTSINVSGENLNYTDIDGVLFDKDVTKLIQYPIGNPRTEYKIPDSVTSIGDFAFSGCTGLASVTIPNSVTSIGKHAFRDCSSLTSVTIPDSVTSIGEWAFYDCSNLMKVTIPDSVTEIGYYAFYECNGITDVYYAGSEDEWNAISIDDGNDCLTNATIHYNSRGSEQMIVGVECASETNEETGAEVIVITVETENMSPNSFLFAVGYGDGGEYIGFAEVEDGAAQLDKNVKTVKVFVWESLESMKPLCEAKRVTVQ